MAEEGKLSLKKKNGNREDPWYVVVRRLMIHWSKGRGVRCRKQTLSDREQDKQNVKEPTSCYTYPENGNTNTATTVPPIHYCPLNPPKTEETTLDCLQVSRNTRGQNDEKNRGDNKIQEEEIQWKTVGYAIRSNWMKKKKVKIHIKKSNRLFWKSSIHEKQTKGPPTFCHLWRSQRCSLGCPVI